MSNIKEVINYLSNQLGLSSKCAEHVSELSPSTIAMVVATLGRTGTVMDNGKDGFSEIISQIGDAYEAILQCKRTGGKVIVDGVQYDPEQYSLIKGVKQYLLPPRLCMFDGDSYTNLLREVVVKPVSPEGLSHLYDRVIAFTRKRDLKNELEGVPDGYANSYQSYLNMDLCLYNGEEFFGHGGNIDVAKAYDVSEVPGLCVGVCIDTRIGFINALAKVFKG